ncbi:hypothetical protein MASR2M78_32940 [Treponema sp.]
MIFWLLFLPGVSPAPATQEIISFDTLSSLSRVLLHDAPALLIILYLLFKGKKPAEVGFGRPKKAEILLALFSLAALVLIALCIALLTNLFPSVNAAPIVEAPRGLWAWISMLFSALATGYLEETYFRAYLFTRLKGAGVDPKRSVLVSVLLFALCHLYEGPWGVLNASLAALVLSISYLYRKSVHAPAWAHAFYNALVYLSGAF